MSYQANSADFFKWGMGVGAALMATNMGMYPPAFADPGSMSIAIARKNEPSTSLPALQSLPAPDEGEAILTYNPFEEMGVSRTEAGSRLAYSFTATDPPKHDYLRDLLSGT